MVDPQGWLLLERTTKGLHLHAPNLLSNMTHSLTFLDLTRTYVVIMGRKFKLSTCVVRFVCGGGGLRLSRRGNDTAGRLLPEGRPYQ